MTAALIALAVPNDQPPPSLAHRLRPFQRMRVKQKQNRQRNKKKFGAAQTRPRSKSLTVKVKPKEEEPCSTRNPQPKVQAPE